MSNRERLLARFLRYVQVDTTAVEGAAYYPSSPEQAALARMLVDELRAMGWTVEGGVARVTLHIILRDFETAALAAS